MTVLIKGSTLVTPERSWQGDVLCADGKIQQLGSSLDAPANTLNVSRGAGRYIKRPPLNNYGALNNV